MSTNETNLPTTFTQPQVPRKSAKHYVPKEWKLVALRECPLPDSMQLCDTPDKAAAYWNAHIATNPYFDPERECFAVLILNTRRRIRGHQFLSMGTMDTLLDHVIVASSTAHTSLRSLGYFA